MVAPRLRQPAIVPRIPDPARAHREDPTAAVIDHFRTVWETGMHDMPFVNPALQVAVPTGFRQVDGDWLGVVVTPWFISLFLLPGGGSLWQDWPSGEQRSVTLPVGPMDFIADNPGADSPLPAYQYCPLISPVQQLADMAAAQEIALAALATALSPPARTEADPPAEPARETTPEGGPSTARRGFLRRLAGR